jgi:subtilisin family serine protease
VVTLLTGDEVVLGGERGVRVQPGLIVDFSGRTPRVAGARVGRELPALSSAAVSAERSADFWATAKNANRVWLDGPVHASLDRSVPQIGAPEAWAAGHTGAGTTVAVLDTGIDVTHSDLSDAVVGARNFTGSETEDDRQGHGTHVASIITGDGEKHRGVAPDAALLNGKVLDDTGYRLESWIIAGMEWAAAGGADMVNMSLGSPTPSDGTDPMSQAVDTLTANTGTLFVIASGNSGGPVASPGRRGRRADRRRRGPRRPARRAWARRVMRPRIKLGKGSARVPNVVLNDAGESLEQLISPSVAYGPGPDRTMFRQARPSGAVG